MPIRRCLVTIGVAAASVEAGLAAWDFATGGSTRIGNYLAACALATVAMTVALYWLLSLPPRDDSDGGLSVGGEDTPPPWWPMFERDFREFDRERRRDRDQPTVTS